MIVTISGPPGSGKTTVSRLLSERLGWRLIIAGEIFRDLAEERGMSLADFDRLAEMDHNIDKELDRRLIAEVKKEENVVLEGRLSGSMMYRHGIPALKIRIDASLEIRSERIAGREDKDKEQVKSEILERERSESTRYREIYGMDYRDDRVYDLIIDSSDKTPEQIVQLIVDEIDKKK